MRIVTLLLATLLALPLTATEWLAGTWSSAARRLDTAITNAKDASTRARLLAKRAHFLIDRSSYHHLDTAGSRQAIDEAIAAARHANDRTALALALHANARWHYFRALDDGAPWAPVDAAIDESLRVQELADAWFYRGLVRQMNEDYKAARTAFERVLALTDDPLLQSFAHRHIGYVFEATGDMNSARVHYATSLAQRRASGAHVLVPFALNLIADAEPNRDRRIELLKESTRTARCAKSWRAVNDAETKLAELSSNRELARKHAQRALEAAQWYSEARMIEEAQKKVAQFTPPRIR